MKKLIKITDTHYVIVDDSVKAGDYVLTYPHKDIIQVNQSTCIMYDKKITHSTEPLDKRNGDLDFIVKGIQEISLSEVEEAINGYNLNTLTKESVKGKNFAGGIHEQKVAEIYFRRGFKAHQELVKDKVFTAQQVIDIVEKSRETGLKAEYFITKYTLPKTEWNIEIQEVTTKSEIFYSNDVPYSTFKITIV